MGETVTVHLSNFPHVDRLLHQDLVSAPWTQVGSAMIGAGTRSEGRNIAHMLHVCELVEGIGEPFPRVTLAYERRALRLPLTPEIVFSLGIVHFLIPDVDITPPEAGFLGLSVKYGLDDGYIRFPLTYMSADIGASREEQMMRRVVDERITQRVLKKIRPILNTGRFVLGALSFAESVLSNGAFDWNSIYKNVFR